MIVKKLKIHQRRYIVNPKLQFGVLLYSILVAISVSIVNQVYRFLLISDTNNSQFYGVNPFLLLIGVNVILCVLIVFAGFYFTNRIAGPIYRLQVHLEEMTDESKIEQFLIRKDDYFQELMVAYNGFLKKLIASKNQK